MGNTLTTKYQVKIFVLGYVYQPISWNCKRDGRPTADNLRKYVESFETSTQPGGPNDHLGVTKVLSATVRLNEWAGEVVAKYEAPKAPLLTLVTTDCHL